MRKQGSNKTSKWSTKFGGMTKHRTTGVSHNHANSIARVREINRELEQEASRREKRKGKMFDSVQELFKSVKK